MKKTLNQLKFVIVTPSYNQGEFIERTICSVLDQKYKYIDYIVVDGGSTDSTVKILKKYDKYIKWVSEKDKGQSDAINKGFRMGDGDLFAWINSDDTYKPNTFEVVKNYFNTHPTMMWVTGDYDIIDKNDVVIRSYIALYKRLLRAFPYKSTLSLTNFIVQPSTFWKKKIIQEIGLIDVSCRYNMDYDYWMRIFQKYPLGTVKDKLSNFRVHDTSINGQQYRKMFEHEMTLVDKYVESTLLKKAHLVHNAMIEYIYDFLTRNYAKK